MTAADEPRKFGVAIQDVSGNLANGFVVVVGKVTEPDDTEDAKVDVVDFFWNKDYLTSVRAADFRVRLERTGADPRDFLRVRARLKDGRVQSKLWYRSGGPGGPDALTPTFDGPGGKETGGLNPWRVARAAGLAAALLGAAWLAGATSSIKERAGPALSKCCPQSEIKLIELAVAVNCKDDRPCGEFDWEVIDFETLVSGIKFQDGVFVDTVAGVPADTTGRRADATDRKASPIRVTAHNPQRPGIQAQIFDSSEPRDSRDDTDLRSPVDCEAKTGVDPFANCTSLSKVLIVPAVNSTKTRPSDAKADGYLEIDFSSIGPVTLYWLDVLDKDRRRTERNPVIEFFDAGGIQMDRTRLVPKTGNNGYVRWSLGPTSGVWKLKIEMHGSGAVDNIVYRRDSLSD